MKKLFGLTVFFIVNFSVKKLKMLKIEYLSSYNLSFRVEVLCLHWNSIEIISPALTFKALKKYERSDVTVTFS